MPYEPKDDLTKMLEEGWSIEGYSTTMMAAGAMTFSTLLRKENRLTAVTVIQNGPKEVSRSVKILAPAEPKNSW